MRINKMILCILLCMSLYGCYDNVELEERGLALAIGIDGYDDKDKSDIAENTMDNNFTVSISMPIIAEGEEKNEKNEEKDEKNEEKDEKSEEKDEKSEEKNEKSEEKNEKNEEKNEKKYKKDEGNKVNINKNIKLADANSIATATNLIDTYMSKKLYYGHTKVIILGEKILSNEKLLKESIDFLERNKEMSRKLIILGSKSSAKDILKIMPKDEKMIGIYINDFYKNNKDEISVTFRLSLEELVKNLLKTGDSVIPSIEVSNNNILLKGLLVIKDYKLVSYLDENITKGLLWVMNKKPYGDISLYLKNKNISVSINKSKVKKDIYEKDGKIIYDINIDLWGSISEYILGENVMIDSNKYKIVEEKLSIYIEKEILNALNKIRQLDADILGLKDEMRRYSYDLYKKYNLENSNIYDKINFNINCDAIIKNANTLK